MIEIKNDICDYHLYSKLTDSSNRDVSCLADFLCECEILFNRDLLLDIPCAHVILITSGMGPCGSFHGSIVPFYLRTEIIPYQRLFQRFSDNNQRGSREETLFTTLCGQC